MAVIETWLKSDLTKLIKPQMLDGNLFSQDNGGNKIGVEVYEGDQAASLSGNVYGYIIRGDNATVTVSGTLSNNKAYIVLPAAAYEIVGRISIVIKVGTMTVGACVSSVYQSSTDTIVDPSHVVPSLDELLARIGDCIDATTAATTATTAANTATSNANTATSAANTAASNANTAAGTANTAATAALQKIDAMTVDAESLASSASPTVTVSDVNNHKHVHFGIPRGTDGRDGVIAQIDMGLFSMQIDSNGDLICTYSTDAPALSIDSNGDLIYTV